MGGKIQLRESDIIVFSGNTIESDVEFRVIDSSALITDDVSVSLSGDSCVDSKSTVGGELCDFEIEITDISMNSTNIPTMSPTISPTTDAPVVVTSSPTISPGFNNPTISPGFNSPTFSPGFNSQTFSPGFNSPTFSPVFNSPTFTPGSTEEVKPESTSIPVSGSSKTSFGFKEFIIPIICLFFIK